MNIPQKIPDAKAEQSVKNLNRWLAILAGFMILYSMAILILIEKKTDQALQMHPVVLLNPNDASADPASYTNLIHPVALPFALSSTNTIVGTNINTPRPMFEHKDAYVIGDFVIVNFFYVEAIVTERLANDMYRVMYRDQNRVLQEILLHRRFLLAPTSRAVVSPFSLLAD